MTHVCQYSKHQFTCNWLHHKQQPFNIITVMIIIIKKYYDNYYWHSQRDTGIQWFMMKQDNGSCKLFLSAFSNVSLFLNCSVLHVIINTNVVPCYMSCGRGTLLAHKLWPHSLWQSVIAFCRRWRGLQDSSIFCHVSRVEKLARELAKKVFLSKHST